MSKSKKAKRNRNRERRRAQERTLDTRPPDTLEVRVLDILTLPGKPSLDPTARWIKANASSRCAHRAWGFAFSVDHEQSDIPPELLSFFTRARRSGCATLELYLR